jgi:hypothetical protein
MSRETIAALGVALVVALGGLWGVSAWQEHDAESRRSERASRRAALRAEGMEQLAELREESAGLMPEMLPGIALGLGRDEVQEIRGTRLERDLRGGEAGIELWIERMPNGAQVAYGFDPRVGLLLQVQILSLLPSVEAIAPHLTAMNERYGRPSGIWNCPDTGGVPTRRFTWRYAETAISDIFLISPSGQVSVTLYLTTNERTAASLGRSSCHPATAEELETFPVAESVPLPGEE